MTDKMLVQAVTERLSPQADVSVDTVEAVLETLFQMGRLAPFSFPASSGLLSEDPAFAMAFQDYLSLSTPERRALLLEVQRRHRDWIARQLEAHRAAWVLVIGGQVVESSPRLDDYPAPERLMQLGAESHRVPFVFTRPPLFEETSWSALPGNDFYPTLPLTVGASDWEEARLLLEGRCLTADFDTGSPYLFLSWDWLLSEGLVTPTPVDFPQTWHHLGKQYVYYTRILRVGTTDEGGNTRFILVACECVEDWTQSPLCEVNPTRSALAGRNLLLRFPLTMELNGTARTTRVTSLTSSP